MRYRADVLDEENAADPYIRLCIHVVRQALRDCIVRPQRSPQLAKEARDNAEDAMDFLLRRMWLGNSVYGEVLRDRGVAPFTLDVVIDLVRRLATGELSRTEPPSQEVIR